MACVCGQYNEHSDWPTVVHYSPIMPTGLLWARKTKTESHIVSNSLINNL